MPRINRADREHVTALSLLEVGEGSVVGDYRLERILARGGMGVVYVARQVSLKRRVVLKLIVPELADNESFRKRFERESRAALEIEHPNIVPVFETGAIAGLLFIAMRYIDGSDLRHVIASDAPLDPRRVLGLVEQIASALDAAHHVGLVHRDVKPGNVLVERLSREREHCYVTDFGLVKRSELSEATSTGKWMGTPAYVAPEQLTGAEVDARADVYSLGVLLFDALAGHPPFQSEHSAGVLLAHLHSPPPRITDVREELPCGLDSVLARAMAKDPAQRYSSAGELAGALAEAIDGHSAGEQRTRTAPIRSPAPPAATAPVPSEIHSNLPLPVSSFIGRARETAEVREALDSSRLVSIVGAGGVGKTRLALEVGRELSEDDFDGIWLIDLGTVDASADAAPMLARTIGVSEAAGPSATEALIEAIAARHLLLLLDNCEHLVETVARLAARMLAACPRLSVLATSREPLSLSGEIVYRLQPLRLPAADDLNSLAESEAANLFIERANKQGSRLTLTETSAPAIASICRALDGIPLALELGAARLRSLSLAELDTRIRARFRVLSGNTRDAPPRQQTLRALIDWSWQLLTAAERGLLARLSMFVGSFDLEAAAALAQDPADDGIAEHVAALVDKSLIQVDRGEGATRYRMLESIRDYAAEKLDEAGGSESAQLAHRDYYRAFAEAAGPRLNGADASSWLERVEADYANMRAALTSRLGNGDPAPGLRIAVALQRFWANRGLAREGTELISELLSRPRGSTSSLLRAQALNALAYLAVGYVGDYHVARPAIEEALAIGRPTGEEEIVCEALRHLAGMCSLMGEPQRGLNAANEALEHARQLGKNILLARIMDAKGLALEVLDDLDGATGAYLDALRLFEGEGDLGAVANTEGHLGNLAIVRRDTAAAREILTHSLEMADCVGDRATAAMAVLNLALVEYLDGDCSRARGKFVAALAGARERGDHINVCYSLFGLALIEGELGHHARAACLHGYADARLESIGQAIQPLEAELRERSLERLRAALGPDALRGGYERGRASSLGDTLELLDQQPAL